jgi:hypothetical protein
MDEFEALSKLKKLSTAKKSADSKGSAQLASSSIISYASTSQSKNETKNDEIEAKFDYYNNSYQKYMQEHGGLEDDVNGNENENGSFDEFDDGSNDGGSEQSGSPDFRQNSLHLKGGGSSVGALDFTSINGGSISQHLNLSPQQAAFNILDHDPFAHIIQKEMIPEKPMQPIGSVGMVKRQYKERERAAEKELIRRHASKIVKIANKVNNATGVVTTGVGPKKIIKKKSSNSNTVDDGYSQLQMGGALDNSQSLGSFDGDYENDYNQDDYNDNDSDHPIIISDLDYKTFTCDSNIRSEIISRITKHLQSGNNIILQTIINGDHLDCKMVLKTISNHMAMFTQNGFIPPEIKPDPSMSCLQMKLTPKNIITRK